MAEDLKLREIGIEHFTDARLAQSQKRVRSMVLLWHYALLYCSQQISKEFPEIMIFDSGFGVIFLMRFSDNIYDKIHLLYFK